MKLSCAKQALTLSFSVTTKSPSQSLIRTPQLPVLDSYQNEASQLSFSTSAGGLIHRPGWRLQLTEAVAMAVQRFWCVDLQSWQNRGGGVLALGRFRLS